VDQGTPGRPARLHESCGADGERASELNHQSLAEEAKNRARARGHMTSVVNTGEMRTGRRRARRVRCASQLAVLANR